MVAGFGISWHRRLRRTTFIVWFFMASFQTLGWGTLITSRLFLVYLDKLFLMETTQESVSTFARIVDRMRTMDEAELKLLYIQLFKDELIKEGNEIASQMNFGDATDEDIVKAIQKKRYPAKY